MQKTVARLFLLCALLISLASLQPQTSPFLAGFGLETSAQTPDRFQYRTTSDLLGRYVQAQLTGANYKSLAEWKALSPQGAGATPVIWTNAVGVSASGNNLTKTAPEAWGNAGASSTQSITSGDGYVEFTGPSTPILGYAVCGLSQGDTDQNWYDIDFGIFLFSSNVYVMENTNAINVGSWSAGDVLRVAVEGGVVKYRKNGQLLYTSTVTPTYPLLVDTAIYINGGTVNNAVLSGGGGNSPPAVNITSPANNATFTAGANITVAASASDSNGSVTKVQFFQGTSLLGEDTTAPYSFTWNNVAAGSYSLTAVATDNLGATTTSSPVAITVNASSGPTPVVWTNVVGVSVSGNSLTKTAPEAWGNAGASSTQSIASGDGYVEFTGPSSAGVVVAVCGLSHGDTDQNWTDIDFGIYLYRSNVYVVENTNQINVGSWSAGDVLRVAVEGGVVKYRKNGQLLYTSTVAPTYPLLVDTAIYINGGTVNNAVISGGGPSNQPPVANAGGPYSGNSGTSIQFNGSASYDPDGTIATYQWNFGDGASGTGSVPAHIYSSAGTYGVTLTVTDNGGATATASASAVITSPLNQPPVADFGGPYSAVNGTPVQFNGTGSYDPDGTITQYRWEFADGTASGASPTHTFAAPGSHLVTLAVTDNGGATNSKSFNLMVAKPGGIHPESENDVRWDPTNRDSLDDPGNRRGNAPNTTTGNNNFQIVAPVLSVPGRGLNLSLNLTYNSLVWNKSTNEILFDIDHDFPAPGWQLGLGKMVMMGEAGAMIIEPDGTRHPFSGKVFTYTYPARPPFLPFPTDVRTFKGQTTDGSNIEYRSEGGTAVARYPNGTVVHYNDYTGTIPVTYLYPSTIVDANGNVISISYLPAPCDSLPPDTTQPRIQRIIDTVGRVYAFHYDSLKRLTSITGPGLSGPNTWSQSQTFVRIHYKTQTLNLSGGFSGLAPRVQNSNSTFSAIDAIYYPATGKGYWFGGDAYSTYGMITKVTEERGMSFLAGANSDEPGTISEGTVTKQQIYDYPSSPAGLTAAPTFTRLTETWDGGPSSAPVTAFLIEDNPGANEHTTTITNPDGTKTIQKAFNLASLASSDSNKFKDGLMKEQQTLDSAGRLLLKTVFTWEKGANDAPRLTRTEATDELGQVLATNYDQYGANNSVGRTREYDYDGTTIIRTTRNTFLSYLDNDLDQGINAGFGGISLIHPRRVNLVDKTQVFVGDDSSNNLKAQTVFKYDEYAQPLQAYTPDYLNGSDLFACAEPRQPNGITGILHHSGFFNPMPPNSQNGGGFGDQYITKRGNLTSIVRYADTSNSSSPTNPITETRTYDMAGNVIAASRACCEQMSSLFELPTQFAFSVSQTSGSADSSSLLRVKTSATFDLKTGLPTSRTDANGRPTTMSYYPDSLRPKEIASPTGARIKFDYDDFAMKVTQTTRLSENGAIASQTVKYLNGAGQVRREEALGVNGVIDIVETTYDQFGRLSQQSRPYRSGETPQWTMTTYDSAGRTFSTMDSSSASSAYYNEPTRPAGASTDPGQTTKTVDPWGRWRWTRLNSSGKLAEVVAPNPVDANASGFQTKYTYDALNNLVRIEQRDQVRRFRYDALGRLTQQKLAEASATLDDSGTYLSSGGTWSDVFTYDARSNMISHTDARGVKTLFSYKDSGANDDPLNRLQSVSYDTSGVDTSMVTVLSSPSVTYQYRTKPSTLSLVDVTQVKQTVAVGVSTEDFDYDTEGRLQERRFTLNGRSQPMTVTYAYDNLGRTSQITYPEQYQATGNPIRKVVTPSYDVASRMDGLKVNGVDVASQIDYNAASQMKILTVGTGTNQAVENYSYDPETGFLMSQNVQRNGATLMSLSYGYAQNYCFGGGDCPQVVWPHTGQITRVDDETGTRLYSYDALSRLIKVRSFASPTKINWEQDYGYDRYGNRTSTNASGTSGGAAIPRDGYQSLAYELTSNRITSSGFSYDPAGNQLTNGTGQTLIYDAAGRLAKVKDQNNATVASYTYGASNRRLITQTGNESSLTKTYYVWEGDSVITEYTDPSGAAMPQWSKNYIYFGARLLATEEPNGSGGELVSYHHPDRLGTRLVTNNANTTVIKQTTLPFGTALDAESIGNPTNRRFTSYDRSATTGLDYAVNRHYDSRQGRFTQPDPLGLAAASLADPQSLNMYSYVGNDPMNRVDPDGQFWGALFQLIIGLFHNLKPNIINGSFAYHNLQPITVSFSTNGQNIGVGYGRIGLVLRSGSWLPKLLAPQEHLQDPCSDHILTRFNLRDQSSDVPIEPYLNSFIATDFQNALNEINAQVPGGIGFTEVFRTTARQQTLWDNRANNPNPVAHPGTSRHESAFAFDVPGLVVRSMQGLDRRNYYVDHGYVRSRATGEYALTQLGQTIVPIFEAHGFEWGGRAINDPVHFQADPTSVYSSAAAAIQSAQAYYRLCIAPQQATGGP